MNEEHDAAGNRTHVSVIIPVHNRSVQLRRALASVRDQDVERVEVLVVDDCSSERIGDVVTEFPDLPIRYVRRKQRGGAAAARNCGIRSARGRFLAFLDSDDEWKPAKLRRQLEFIDRHPDCALCCTSYVIINQHEPPSTRRLEGEYRFADLAFGCGLSPGSTLFACKWLFEEVGGFDETLVRLEDWDWLLRATRHSSIGTIPEPLAVIHLSGWPSLTDVRDATRTLAQRHSKQFRKRGLPCWLQFRAALAYERAVAAYRSGYRVAAASLYIWSLMIYPMNRFGQFRRISRRLRSAHATRAKDVGRVTERESKALSSETADFLPKSASGRSSALARDER